MINIAIIGYGKMGRRIESLAREKGFGVKVIIDNDQDWAQYAEKLTECDVAVEFSTPSTAFGNVSRLLEAGVPVVSGTTGWDSRLPEAIKLAETRGVGLMAASNFSIGMNVFFRLNRYLASMMNEQSGYLASLEETHHIHKLDAPSGTAKKLAADLIDRLDAYSAWKFRNEVTMPGQLPVTSIREGEVTGVHSVNYKSDQDSITITHEAMNRDGFVFGALAAAEWIIGRTGFQTMERMLFGE